MAKISLSYTSIFFIVLIIISSPVSHSSNFFPRSLKNTKLTHLRFFFHDITRGNNPTAITVANASNSNGTYTFGSTLVIDDPLTSEPELRSKQVGRAQGIYSMTSLPSSETAIQMVMSFVFTEGKYNGSTLSLLGHNAVLRNVREMPIVGGTGFFRFARGFVLAHTYALNFSEAIVEYNVHVLH